MDTTPAYKPGSLAARFFAEVIDRIFLFSFALLVNTVFKANAYASIAAVTVSGLYHPLLTSISGMTIGKWLCRIKVTGPDMHTKPRLGQAFLREWIGKFVSSLVFGLGYLTALLDGKNRTWHDKIADTYVVALDARRQPVPAESSEVPITAARRILFWLVTVVWILVSLLIPTMVLGYLFVARPNQINGHSMDPNYQNGQYILTDMTAYKRGDPMRGDVVTFMSPTNSSILNIGRIIGMPGETMRIAEGYVFINGKRLDESGYLPKGTVTYTGSFIRDGKDVSVPQGEYFIMGDNRTNSSDSREYGFVGRASLQGKVQWCYWNCAKQPFKVTVLPGMAPTATPTSAPTVAASIPVPSQIATPTPSVSPTPGANRIYGYYKNGQYNDISLDGLKVTITSLSTGSVQERTSKPYFEFNNLPPGQYKMEFAQIPGYTFSLLLYDHRPYSQNGIQSSGYVTTVTVTNDYPLSLDAIYYPTNR